MLSSLTMELENVFDQVPVFEKSSLFHGFLMEMIDDQYAEVLHEDGWKPYSQNLVSRDEKIYWTIHTLNEEAYHKIIQPLLHENISQITLKHNDLSVPVTSKTIKTGSYHGLVDEYFFGQCPRYANIRFMTPLAFKQSGKYVFHPDLRLMYQNLMMRFDSFAEKESVYSEETLDQLTEYTEIKSYNLRSFMYPLEGIRVPSFWGTLQLKIHGPQPLVNLANMLLRYGEYSGIGIKTALGMGSIKIFERGKHT